MVANLGLLLNDPGSGLNIPIDVYLDPKPNSSTGYVEEFDGKIACVGIDDTGNGYTSPNVPISLEGGEGEGAILSGIFVGSINNIIDLVGGNGYKEKPNIIFEGTGLRAEAICEISGFIKSVDVANPGIYTNIPEISVYGDGQGAKLKANISGYIFRTILVSGGKFPVDVIPTVTIITSGNINYGGNIVPTMKPIDDNYATIASLSIVTEGSGYPSPPSLSILGNIDGYPASGYCLINGGISSIEILDPGHGYTSMPYINIKRNDNIPSISGRSFNFINQIIESQTPTQTPTPTPSFTPTNTVTKTITVTNSCTNTITSTQASTSTPTPTKTPIATSTNRVLHGPINTANLPTSTVSPSPTTTKTVTPSSTVTPSFTASPTVTRTQTQTLTITKTKTSTPTLTKTSSPTPTNSATQTITPSHTINNTNPPVVDAVLIPRMSYGVSKINILEGGSYSSDPTIIIEPPITAEDRADITYIGLTRSFANNPSLTIRGSTVASPYKETREPKAIPIINYSIGSVDIINSGYNYTVPPTIRLIGGYDPIKGSKGIISATVSNGAINSINIDNNGNFYRTAPIIDILSNDYGYGLELKVTLSGTLEDIYITDPGLNLTKGTPNTRIFIEGGNGPINSTAKIICSDPDQHDGDICEATPELNYKLRSIQIIDRGNGYSTPPNIIIGPASQKDFSRTSKARVAKAQAKILGLVKKINITKGPCAPASGWIPGIYLRSGPISNQLAVVNSLSYYIPHIIATELNNGSYDISYSGNFFFNNAWLFPQKPHIILDTTIPRIIANTYLPISSFGAYGPPWDIVDGNIVDSGNVRTFKSNKINRYNSVIQNNLLLSSKNFKSLNDFNNPYSSVAGYNDYSESPILSVVGQFGTIEPDPNTGLIDYNNGANSYTTDINDTYRTVQMFGFFDTTPVLDIEDEIGFGANISISSNFSNSMIKLYDSKSGNGDLSINNVYNYSSYSTLICKEPGIPLSWNNKPEFNVHVSGGHITNVEISDGGLGFAPQNADGNYHYGIREIYFSGGGGSGAKASYVTDFNFFNLTETDQKTGAISGVLIVNSGEGYVSAPEAIVIDHNPTWKDYFFHNKSYPSGSVPTISPYFSPFQLLDFNFTAFKVYECKSFINNFRLINKQLSTSYISQFDTIVSLPYYTFNIFGNNGYVDNILFSNDSSRSDVTRYPSIPNINIQNESLLSAAGYSLPELSAYIPRWNKDKFSETLFIRDDNVIE